jgi:hypothetical protein
MTEVKMGDEVIETDLPAEAVADLQQPAEPAEPTVEPAPETPVNPEPTAPPEKVEEPVVPTEPEKVERPQKPKPIADLLSKKHEAEERASAAEARAQELETKLAQASKQPVQSDDDIKALAEEYGLDETLISRLINTARKGSELPKEVQDLLAERATEKQQQAELTAFNKRVDSLAKALPDESFANPKVKEKLLELAYSTEKAPDGEPYYQKELSELYFAYIKPEIEPGQSSAEPSQGGTQTAKVMDFAEILNDESKMEEFAKTASSEKWQAFEKWRDEKQGDTPIIRRTN